MNIRGPITLNFTEEFRIACKINNLRPTELLQYFIDHVSFYAFIGGDMEATYLWATTVSVECKESLGGKVETVTDPDIKAISLKYIKQLTALSLEVNLSNRIKTSRSLSMMKDWAVEMLPLTDYEVSLQTKSGTTFDLSFDFNLLCRMNGIEIQHLLQYFIDHISLARERAVNIRFQVKTEASMAVLLLLVSSHEQIRHKVLPHQEIYKRYGLRLLKLDKLQKQEASLENRIKIYRLFYQDWFHSLNSHVN